MNKSSYRLLCAAVFFTLLFMMAAVLVSASPVEEKIRGFKSDGTPDESEVKMFQNEQNQTFSLADLLKPETWYILIEDLTNNLVNTFGPELSLILLSIIYILLLIAQVILAPLPGVVFFVSAGFLYPFIFAEHMGLPPELGVVVGTIVGTTGSCLGALVAWGISYAGGYPIARKFLGESTMEEATNWLNRWGAMGIFLARMMPFAPSDPVSYIAGAGRMKFKTFIIPVIIGSLIATTLYTIMGYIVYRTGKDLSEGITSEMELADTILLAIFLGCLLLVAVVIVYQRRKLRELDRVAVPDDGFLTPEEIAAKSSPDPATSQEEIIERYEKAQKTGLEMDKALVTSFAIGFTIVLYIIVLAWLVINGIFLT